MHKFIRLVENLFLWNIEFTLNPKT